MKHKERMGSGLFLIVSSVALQQRNDDRHGVLAAVLMSTNIGVLCVWQAIS